MQISRADIRGDDIDNRRDFIKLPVRPYLELIGIEPLPSQIAIINALNNPKYRFVCAAISRRQGKTYIANIIGQLVSLVPNCSVLIMSPNYALSNISFDLQRSLIRQFDLEVRRDNSKDRVIELENDSTIRIGSVNQVDSCVGRSYDFIIFDEAALTREGEEAFNVSLRPTLDKDNSKALFISTPRGRNNWFSKFYTRGFSEDFPQWVSIHATWHDNPRTSSVDIEEARRAMSAAEFAQEYMADFTQYEGQVWKFDRDKCVQDLSELDLEGMDVIAGLDVGFRDPTALCVLAYDGQFFYALAEYYAGEKTTEKHAEAVQEYIDRYNIDYIFMDSAAQQTRFDFAQNYGISTINAKKSVNDGIAAVAALVDNDRLIVDQTCHRMLASLDQYQWDPNPNLLNEKPLHNEYSHMADALRYAIYSFETHEYTF